MVSLTSAMVISMVMAVCPLLAQVGSSHADLILVTYMYGNDNSVVVDTTEQYYVLPGTSITYRCVLSAESRERLSSVRWMRNGVLLKEMDANEFIVYQVNSATAADIGEYVCELEYLNGEMTPLSANILGVVDTSRIVAPGDQYGITGTSTGLQCTTTFENTNSVSIMWKHNGQYLSSNVIKEVQLSDEGVYTCEVFLGSFSGLNVIKEINFTVIVPPTIISKPESIHLYGYQVITFSVQFNSRFHSETVIVWYKDDISAVPQNMIQTIFENSTFGQTQVQFSPLQKRDAGTYRVVIENTFSEIPVELRQTEAYFSLEVTVLPVAPHNTVVNTVSSDSTVVRWELANQNEDDLPDNVTVRFEYSNGTVATQTVVAGSQREVTVRVVPGMTYTVLMTAANQDGRTKSESIAFRSLPGPPATPALTVTRVSETSFNLCISLLYTGGGNITRFIVSFRRIGTMKWLRLDPVDAERKHDQQWRVAVMHEDFLTPGVEFQVSAENTMGYVSEVSSRHEPIEVPGTPRQLTFISSSPDSILINVQLSSVGASPFLSLEVIFLDNSSPNYTIAGPYQPGELVEVSIEHLEENTLYKFSILAVNYGGKGGASLPIQARTEPLPLVPLYTIAFIVLAAVLAIVFLIITFVLLVRYFNNIQQSKRKYKFNSGNSADTVTRSLESGHQKEIVSPPSHSFSSPVPSSGYSERSLSQAAFSHQGSCPISPQRTISTSDGGVSPTDRFRFERRNSSATSTNTDTESEANYPRYTYMVSPSTPELFPMQIMTRSLHPMRSHHSSSARIPSSTSIGTRDSVDNPAEFIATNV